MGLPHYKNVIPPAATRLLLVTEAPPLPAVNYFYNVSMNDNTHDSSRSFFRGIMQGIGLLPVGVSVYSERALLDAFLGEGYFLVDSCPFPLVNEHGEQLPSNKKKQIMVKYTDTLHDTIKQINPDKILFVCSTNQSVMEKLNNDPYIRGRLLLESPLPYPGVGWLRRPDKKGFMDLLPDCYRLAPIY